MSASPVQPPHGNGPPRDPGTAPFADVFVTITKQEHIQLKTDAQRWQILHRKATFVESERHRGTCYKAANWINIGQTTGRGKKSSGHQQIVPIKDIWLYPLRNNFASLLCA